MSCAYTHTHIQTHTQALAYGDRRSRAVFFFLFLFSSFPKVLKIETEICRVKSAGTVEHVS